MGFIYFNRNRFPFRTFFPLLESCMDRAGTKADDQVCFSEVIDDVYNVEFTARGGLTRNTVAQLTLKKQQPQQRRAVRRNMFDVTYLPLSLITRDCASILAAGENAAKRLDELLVVHCLTHKVCIYNPCVCVCDSYDEKYRLLRLKWRSRRN